MDNKFFVGNRAGNFVFLIPIPREITEENAINLAAWIVAMLPDREKFDAAVREIEGE